MMERAEEPHERHELTKEERAVKTSIVSNP
jgi:hypothetical protein